MPKLNANKAEEVSSATSQFSPIPEGIWPARLKDVESKTSQAGNTYWSWEYEVSYTDENGASKTGRIWDNTSLSDAAAWRLKKVFDAFGMPVDTDTDELCGRWVNLSIEQKVIEQGQRKGEVGNNVANILAHSEDEDADLDF